MIYISPRKATGLTATFSSTKNVQESITDVNCIKSITHTKKYLKHTLHMPLQKSLTEYDLTFEMHVTQNRRNVLPS